MIYSIMVLRSYHLICAQEGRHVRMHNHKSAEFVYYFNGVGKSTINQKEYPVKSGVFTITPKGIYHDQENFTELRSFCILLDDPELEQLTGSWIDIDGSIRSMLFTFFDEVDKKRPGYEEICKGLAYEIVGRAERIVSECEYSTHPTKEEIVRNAIELIEKRDGLVTVGEVAESLNVSPDYLRHLFSKCGAESPHRFIMNVKLERAKTVLTDSGLSISRIAEMCGFGDVYYFSNLFKKKTAYSPTDFRSQFGSISN